MGVGSADCIPGWRLWDVPGTSTRGVFDHLRADERNMERFMSLRCGGASAQQ